MQSLSNEGEAGANFVAGAFGSGEGFEEDKFGGGECGYGILFAVAEGLFQRSERAGSGAALCAGKGDMRMIRAILRKESAGARGRGDLLLEGEEFGREDDARVEDANAVEEIEALDPDRNGSGVNLFQVRGDAGCLVVKGLAEELEGHVPSLFPRPAEIVAGSRRKAIAQSAEDSRGVFRERNGDEEPHGRTRVPG